VAALALLVLVMLLAAGRAEAATTALFDLDVAGPQEADSDRGTVELGVRVKVTAPLAADGIAFYRAPGHPLAGGRVHLWQGNQLIASGHADPSAADGWVSVDFDDGTHTLSPGTEYVASYTAVDGDYVATTDFFDEPYAPGGSLLRAPADAGVYQYLDDADQPQRPTSSWASSNYWVTVYGEPGEATPPPPSTGPWALFDSSAIISEPVVDDPAAVELGTRFSVDDAQPYKLTKIRIFRDSHTVMSDNYVFVYDEDGVQVANGLLASEGGFSGFLDIPLHSPVRLEPNKTYTVSYLSRYGYPEEQRGFAEPVQAGPLTFPADAGVYRYGGGFPSESWNSTSYYVSPIVDTDTSTPEPPPVGAPGDVTRPVAQFGAGTVPGNWYTPGYTKHVMVSATDSQSPLKVGRLYIDGVLTSRVTTFAFGNYYDFLIVVPAGSHTLKAEVEDAAGNVGEATLSFYTQQE
jgi:hypothetical protein